MLTQDDFQRYMPDVAEIRRHLNIAILKSGVDIPEDACQHYFTALILMERLVHKVEHRAWDKLESTFTSNGSVSSSPESSVLVELVSILSIGGAETAEDLQEFRGEFEEINQRLNIVVLSTEPAVGYGHFLKALLLMKSLAYNMEQMVWEGLKAGVMAALMGSEDDDESGLGKGGRIASGLGILGGGTAAGMVTGAGGFGIAAGGTAFGIAGLAGAAVATGGTALAGAAAAYGLYRAGSWALNTQRGQDAKEQMLEQTQNAREQIREQTRNMFKWNPWERWRNSS